METNLRPRPPLTHQRPECCTRKKGRVLSGSAQGDVATRDSRICRVPAVEVVETKRTSSSASREPGLGRAMATFTRALAVGERMHHLKICFSNRYVYAQVLRKTDGHVSSRSPLPSPRPGRFHSPQAIPLSLPLPLRDRSFASRASPPVPSLRHTQRAPLLRQRTPPSHQGSTETSWILDPMNSMNSKNSKERHEPDGP